MKADRLKRAQNVLDGMAEYAAIHGDRFCVYMLPGDHPLPAPQLKDVTLMSDSVMVIIPDGNVDRETEDVLN